MSAAQAYLVRDFRVAWSYRFSFFFQYIGMFGGLISMRFLSDIVGTSAALMPYGGDYFSFAVIGMSIQVLLLPALNAFRGAVREAQVMGTFEAMLMTRERPAVIVASAATYPLTQAILQPILLIPIVGIAMGAQFRYENLWAIVAILLLTMLAMAGIGLCSAAFTIAFRQNEPFTAAIFSVATVLSGVVYPVSVLPGWLQPISTLLPSTHALQLARASFLEGANVPNVAAHLAALVAFCGLFPLGLFAVHRAIEHARRTGTLAQY